MIVFFQRISFVLFLVSMSYSLKAQVIITGKVIDQAQNVVPKATLMAYHPNDSTLLGFSIASVEGDFTLKLKPSNTTEICVLVRSLSFKPLEKMIPYQNQQIFLELHEASEILDEIEVRSKAITEEGDTLLYQVANFTKKEDQVLEDVLKNMPGIEIESNGQITFQGRPINKFYIEGKDLLESKYALASQNIPHQAVTTVEVIKEHQPIKMLEDVVKSVDPAINITLKQGITFTGTAELGAGIPNIWQAKIAPMFFSKEHQTVNELTSTNSGKDYLSKFNAVNLYDALEFGSFTDEKITPLLGSNPVYPPLFEKDAINFHETHTLSTNYITFLKKGDLKVNVNAYYDDVSQDNYSDQLYILGKDSINLTEQIGANYRQKYINPKFVYESNQKAHYFKNTLGFQILEQTENSHIFLNDNSVVQKSKRTFYDINNKLSNIVKLGNYYLRLNSIVSYRKEPQQLQLYGGPLFDTDLFENNTEAVQDLALETFKVYAATKFIRKWNAWQLETAFKLNYKEQSLYSDIIRDEETISDGLYQNDVKNRIITPEISPRFSFTKKGFYFQVTPNITYQYIKLQDSDKEKQLSKPLLQPNTVLTYKWRDIDIDLNSVMRTTFTTLPSIHSGYIIPNFREVYQRDIPILETDQKSFDAGINYEFVPLAIFLSANGKYEENTKDWISALNVNSDGLSSIEIVDIDSNLEWNKSLSINGSTFISALKANLSLEAEFGKASQNVLIQDVKNTAYTDFTNYMAEVDLSLNKWLSLASSYNYQNIETLYENTNTSELKQETIGADFKFFMKKHSLFFENKLLMHSMLTENVLLSDLVYRYQWKEKKVSFEVNAQNLWNHQTYVQTNFTASSIQSSYYQLRPRQILFSVKFFLGDF